MWICKCGFTNEDTDKICQNCGDEREKCEKSPPMSPPINNEPNNAVRNLVIMVVVGLAICVVFIIINAVSGSNKDSVSDPDYYHFATSTPKIEYEQYALSAVSEHLKSPPTLQNYSLIDSNKNGEYIVKIKVSSQNSFGAELYSTWVVYLRDIKTSTGSFNYTLRECSDEILVDSIVEALKKNVDWKE